MYYATLCSLYIKIKCIAFVCRENCSTGSYNVLMICSKLLKRSATRGFKFGISARCRELNTLRLTLQRAGSALYRETVEMLLQRNSELAISEQRYSKGLLYVIVRALATFYYGNISYEAVCSIRVIEVTTVHEAFLVPAHATHLSMNHCGIAGCRSSEHQERTSNSDKCPRIVTLCVHLLTCWCWSSG
jgi:hypothetical protein